MWSGRTSLSSVLLAEGSIVTSLALSTHNYLRFPLRHIQSRILAIAALVFILFTLCSTAPALAEKPADVSLLSSTNRCPSCDLSGVDLSDVQLPGINLKSADLSRINLSGANLAKSNLKSTDLSHANLQSVQLQSADLSNSNLSGANLSNASLSEAILSNADLVGANLSGADLSNARFSGWAGAAKLSLANLSNAKLQGSNLRNTSLVDADLSGADLSNQVDLRGTKLNGTNLSRANLIGVNLVEAHLSNVNLRGAKLNGANLSKATLTGADLRDADLTNIDLTDATLSGTLGLDPYAKQLFLQANEKAAVGEFVTAVSYLNRIPEGTEVYTEAQKKTGEYTQLQREAEAKQMLQKAENSAGSRNYQEALNYLKKIPVDTEAYSKAQEKIAEYKEASIGIGVTRQAIRSIFEQPDLGFTFETSSPVNDQPHIIGNSDNQLARIDLIGSQNNLSRASITIVFSDNPVDNYKNSAFIVGFLKEVSLDWENDSGWLESNFERIAKGIQSEAITTHGNQEIQLQFIKELRFLVLNVRAKQVV